MSFRNLLNDHILSLSWNWILIFSQVWHSSRSSIRAHSEMPYWLSAQRTKEGAAFTRWHLHAFIVKSRFKAALSEPDLWAHGRPRRLLLLTHLLKLLSLIHGLKVNHQILEPFNCLTPSMGVPFLLSLFTVYTTPTLLPLLLPFKRGPRQLMLIITIEHQLTTWLLGFYHHWV